MSEIYITFLRHAIYLCIIYIKSLVQVVTGSMKEKITIVSMFTMQGLVVFGSPSVFQYHRSPATSGVDRAKQRQFRRCCIRNIRPFMVDIEGRVQYLNTHLPDIIHED